MPSSPEEINSRNITNLITCSENTEIVFEISYLLALPKFYTNLLYLDNLIKNTFYIPLSTVDIHSISSPKLISFYLSNF